MRDCRHRARAVLGAGFLLLTLTSCANDAERGALATGAFRNALLLEQRLQRGVSRKADVQAVLGVPNGTGSALFPQFPGGAREIWFYEDTAILSIAGGQDIKNVNVRLQLMFVFFKGDAYDGHLWSLGTARH